MKHKVRIAFVKFGGLSAGGTEKWLQMMAANLPAEQYKVTFFYCDSAPYVGSTYVHPGTDPSRLAYLAGTSVKLVEFKVGKKDLTQESHPWLESNFWDLFNESEFDLVVTGKAGPEEYPYFVMSLPIIEYVALGTGVDTSASIAWSIHCSEWQRRRWIKMGGTLQKSSVLPVPCFELRSRENLRAQLGISSDVFVTGMHQRDDDGIFSDVPLKAFKRASIPNSIFLILGGSTLYSRQASRMGIKNFIQLPHSADEHQISTFLNTLNLFTHGRRDGETFGAVIAEAMAHGLPVVTHNSKIGANAQAETIGPGGVFACSVAEYAESIVNFAEDFELLKQYSKKAMEFSNQNYSLASISKKFIEVVSEVLNQGDGIPEKRFDYGRSPLGYLQYGELNNPSSIAHHIVEENIPEEYDLLISSFFLRSSKSFLDVGSNIGLYCLYGASLNPILRVHSFEPQLECVDQLNRSIYLNNWEERISVHPFALGDSAAESALYLDGTGSSLLPDFSGLRSDSIQIPVKKLDDLALDSIDFMKIDVEGNEFAALSGGLNSIEAHKPVIFLELIHHITARNYHNNTYVETIKLLRELGYVIYRSDAHGKLRLVRGTEAYEGVHMHLCLPNRNVRIKLARIRSSLLKRRIAKKITSLSKQLRRHIKRNAISLLSMVE